MPHFVLLSKSAPCLSVFFLISASLETEIAPPPPIVTIFTHETGPDPSRRQRDVSLEISAGDVRFHRLRQLPLCPPAGCQSLQSRTPAPTPSTPRSSVDPAISDVKLVGEAGIRARADTGLIVRFLQTQVISRIPSNDSKYA